MKLGSTSKRTPLARKYNITKKAKSHDRKQKRDAKKNPALRKKLRKDPGIPNLNPFKEKILKQLEEQKKIMQFAEAQRTRRSQALSARRKLGAGSDLAGMAADASARASAFSRAVDAGEDAVRASEASAAPASAGRAGEQTRRAFYKHIKVLMEKADILLVVLDARDPLACRAPAVEALALSLDPPKRVVLVLNKIDLVPPEVVRQWLAYLRRDFPTVAFKASTQQQREHLSSRGGAAVNKATEEGEAPIGAGAAGADTLLQLIKNYSRSHDIKTAVTVGVIGYPNVGKSSVINSLKRSKAVGVSPTPGFTRTLQEVSLDAKVTLIDCPGIIFDDDAGGAAAAAGGGAFGGGDAGAGLLLRNCVSVDSIEDPEGAVDAILKRCVPAKLVALYGISMYDSTADFLRQVAAKRGKLGKGGIPNREAAARCVLHDWNTGKIPFFVLPPSAEAGGASSSGGDDDMGAGSSAAAPAAPHVLVSKDDSDIGSSAIVHGWSKEFDLDALLRHDASVVAAASAKADVAGNVAAAVVGARSRRPSVRPKDAAAKLAAELAAAAAAVDGDDDDDEDDEDFEMDGAGGDDDDGEEDDDDDEEDDDDDDDDEEEEEEEVEMAPRGRRASHASAPAPFARVAAPAASAAQGRGRGAARAPAPAAPAPAPAAKSRAGKAASAAAPPPAVLAAPPPAAAAAASAPLTAATPSDSYDFGRWFGGATTASAEAPPA